MFINILRKIYNDWLAILLLLLGIYLTSFYSYLLFHSLAELFTISIIVSIFIVTWNTRRNMDNSFMLVIGIASFFIGILDSLHLLAFKGMGVFQWSEPTNLPTQLWIVTRYLLSGSFLAAALMVHRKPNSNTTFLVYAFITAILIFSIFYWRNFPVSYIEGSGLTLFKRVSEYIISLIFLVSIIVLYRTRRNYETKTFRLLAIALVITIAAEVSFTDYVNVYGAMNLVGHLLIVISFYLIYKAIIETSLTNPFSLLFRNLKNSEERLEKHAQELDRVNSQLLQEVEERKEAEKELRGFKENLENLVAERTSLLQESHQKLEFEIAERKRAEEELRGLSNRIIDLQEDERHAIAQELHDEIGQLLTALNMLLIKIKREGEQAKLETHIPEDVSESRQLMKEILQRIRTLSVNLHPSMLDNIGLMPTLKWYFEEYTRRTGIIISFFSSGSEGNLASKIRLTAFRIIQEALTNVARYADVEQAYVQIQFVDHTMKITIEDQGKGFNVSDLSLSSSGIRGMRERAFSVGGNFAVFSSAGAGTRVEVVLPLVNEDQ